MGHKRNSGGEGLGAAAGDKGQRNLLLQQMNMATSQD